MRAQFLGILVSRGLGSGLQALALIVLARSVPASSFGAVASVIALVGFLLVVTGFGMAAFVPRARALGADDDVQAGLRLNAASTALTTPVLLAVTAWWAVETGAPLAVALICLSLGLERNVDTVLGVPIADGDARTAAVSMVLRRSVSLAVLLVALAGGLDPVLAYTAGLLLGAVAGQVHVRRRVRDLPGSASAVPAKDLARRGWPFLVANVAGQARTLDVPLVAAVLTPAAAGLYAAAVKLVQPLLLVPQSLAAVVAPRSARLEPPAARRLAVRLVGALLAGGLVLVPFMVVGEQIVTFLMGPTYAGSGPVLAWTLAGLPFFAVSAVLAALLQGQSREHLVAVVGVASAVVTVLVVPLGAVTGGITGAAIALTCASALRAGVLATCALR
ncbi:lipopolysaccharide biosynthesis protein [uncultured Cellulomonas sp.]|uniref:lipopolysaccharide biosynthesis protein n=1 Tax=uncultured Cellulomonas sp. TaxID=189682 RepID=UPI0028E9177F|nr:lipopolysaccharide biosynthesis protein [uncultured Cellulomonas sp.]